MKINMPVTGVARDVDPARPLVSETDIKGILTYANDAFVEISGFSRKELIGKSHNIVRHPDMPPEAFQDLWDTIKSGKPWRGIVKNRSKNGDHYWVEAYVTPIYKHSDIVGYKSVRGKPSAAEISACEALYREVREKRATLPSSRPSWMKRLSLRVRINLAIWSLFLLLPFNLLLDYFGVEAVWVGMVSSVVGLAVASIMAWSLQRSIAQPLRSAQACMEQIAEGNLNHRMTTTREDEFGQLGMAIESMRIHLRAIIADVLWASKRTEQNAETLAMLTRNLLTNFENEAERVTSTSAAMEEMSTAIAEISEHTEAEAATQARARQIVEQGNQKMAHSLEASKRVESAVVASGATINELNTAIQKIGEVTLTIKEIAEQTNLLALNAAIEAARAGEQGRGFAVVADEVRKLAERTSSSTVDITRMVENIRATTNNAVASMDNAVREVKGGMVHIQGSSASLQEILQASNEVDGMIQSTALTLKEQSQATGEVTRSMEEITTLFETNHHDLNRVDEGIDALTHTARELALLVKRFEKSIDG